MSETIDSYDSLEEMFHYGMPRRSGRYPWGSGENPFQSANNFLGFVNEFKKNNPGATDEDIYKTMGMNSREYREYRSYYKHLDKQNKINQVLKLKEKQHTTAYIAEKLGIPEPTVRSYLKPGEIEKTTRIQGIKNRLETELKDHKYIDIGRGVDAQLGVSREALNTAVSFLEDEGWVTLTINVPQVNNPANKTPTRVLAPPGTEVTDVYREIDQLHTIMDKTSEDYGKTWTVMQPPTSVNSKRIDIVYGSEGGSEADGLIKIRPGVKDLSMGANSYAQVRIAVDGTHYLKGLAVYDSELPPGKDIQFFTPKERSKDPHDVMKPMKVDPLTGEIDATNPFGSSISRQNESKTLNIIRGDGDWDDWNKNLSSQMLSKQTPELAKRQLGEVVKQRQLELKEIQELTNPTLKKHLLEKFAESLDSDAVDLKAAAMPRQSTNVIVPIPSLKAEKEGVNGKPGRPGEIFAPRYNDGEEVVLIRYPHAGIFEIPTLRVNNKNKEALRLIGANAPDAVGINAATAAKMSGGDFDGDFVLVIPNETTGPFKVKAAPSLEGLKDFNPVDAYPKYEGMKVLKGEHLQREMGITSNLVTDMTILGAPHSDIVKAVRHTMVIIDAEKKELDWKRSEEENEIRALKKQYQLAPNYGSSTIISRAKSPKKIPERKLANVGQGGPIDPKTGELRFVDTGKTARTYDKKTGTWVEGPRMVDVSKLALTNDARTLMSSKTGTLIERVYADHSNKLKAMANSVRKETLSIKNIPYSPSAAKVYSTELAELRSKLMASKSHAPIERLVQRNTNSIMKAYKEATGNALDAATEKKLKARVLAEQRARLGAKTKVTIEPRHWEAIQSGAVSANLLGQLLTVTDLDIIKGYATPRNNPGLTPTQVARARAMLGRDGITQAQVAQALGVSPSTLVKALKEGV